MKVTKIAEQVKKADRVSVFIDGEYAFSLSLDQLVTAGLKTGDEISDQQILDYKKLSDEGKLYEKAVMWALRRAHSEREIRDYLHRKVEEPEVIDNLLNRLKDKGFVDDEYFSRLWAENRRRLGYSHYVIRGELIKKGVDKDIIGQVLEDTGTDQEALKIILAKKMSKYPNQQKLIAYLASRGFRYSDIKQALESDLH